MVWKREWAAISADAETAQFQTRASARQDLRTALGWVAGKLIVGCGYFLQSCSMDETRRQTKSGRFAVQHRTIRDRQHPVKSRIERYECPEQGTPPQSFAARLSFFTSRYVADPPLTIMRVTPQTRAAIDPFPVPRLRVRGTGQTEMDLMNKLEELRAGIVAANPGLAATDFRSHPYWYEGYDYLQRGVDPDGDTRDCFFLTAGWVPEYGSSDEITLGDGEFLMVYGANHTATGKATYASVNVYASETAKLLIGCVTDDDLQGSATPYLPAGDPAAKKLYAYKVSRDCVRGEPGCLQLSVPEGCTRLTLDSKTVLGLVFRMFAEPATKVGPAMPEILYDRIVKFSPRPSKSH